MRGRTVRDGHGAAEEIWLYGVVARNGCRSNTPVLSSHATGAASTSLVGKARYLRRDPPPIVSVAGYQ